MMIPNPEYSLRPRSDHPLLRHSQALRHARRPPASPGLQQVSGAPHPLSATIQSMRVDHGRVDVLVAEQFLESTNVIAGFQQMRGTCMPHAMTARRLGKACLPHRLFHGPLQNEPPHVMLPLEAASRIHRAFGRGKDLWPRPFAVGLGVLVLQGVWHVDGSEPLWQVPGMKLLDVLHMALQGSVHVERQHGHPVFRSLPVPDQHLMVGEVDVFDPHAETRHQPQAGPVSQIRHNPGGAG